MHSALSNISWKVYWRELRPECMAKRLFYYLYTPCQPYSTR